MKLSIEKLFRNHPFLQQKSQVNLLKNYFDINVHVSYRQYTGNPDTSLNNNPGHVSSNMNFLFFEGVSFKLTPFLLNLFHVKVCVLRLVIER